MGPDLQGWEVLIIDIGSGEITPIDGPDWQRIPTWSPSGHELAYVSSASAATQQAGPEQPAHWLTIYSIADGAERR